MLRTVLVGCGAMSKAWLNAARQVDGVSIVGLVDIDLDRARSRAAEFGLDGADTGASLEAMLERADPTWSSMWSRRRRACRSPNVRLITAVTC
jgi:predicted dehydrogenase